MCNLLSVRNLHFRYGEQPDILSAIDIDVSAGKVTAILGPSGCGKTTLLRLMTGQIKPQKGSILFQESTINTLPQSQLYILRRKMGMLFQNAALFPQLTSFENVVFPVREHTCLPETVIQCLGLMKLRSVGLPKAAHLMPNELSGGMARRVALARAVVLDPELVFYDEPFAGLDPIASSLIAQLIANLTRILNVTAVLVSHDVHTVIKLADFIYVLANGKMLSKGKPEEIKVDSNPEVQEFIHGVCDKTIDPNHKIYTQNGDVFENSFN